ncbi:MAG TPA: glycosyltransferase [Pseudomonas xinjiangensis]|uniref:Glycosyltransferase n=2 Tax=root TaxID=1 RepID=A0A7V1BQ97_9GAMM|nr:glycosyltransferase [Halopseudomonas xinjiangensis]HEC47305.1 glycosyltransferase [Halopseudomonas xinjiangensis]
MSHFAVIAPAFPSHFSALESLSIELLERGHSVTFIHRLDAAAWLRSPEIGFHAVGLHSHPPGSLARTLRLAANPGGPLGLRRLIMDMARTTDMLCRELPALLSDLSIDALLCDQMEAAGGLVAEAAGLPYVSVACALPVNREPGIPLPVMPMAYRRDERSARIYQGSTQVYDWMMGPHRRVIAQHAKAFGLSARDGLHECLSPYAQISQTVAGFDFPRFDLPPHFYHVGPLRSAGHAAQELNFPVDPHRELIFASLGTLQGQRFGLFKRIAKACRALDVQLLVAHCGGLDADQAKVLEKTGATWVTDFAPQQAVLARANAVVSHAGLNTVMDALVARTPILALPIAFDQAGVASRVCHAGVGLKASAQFVNSRTLSGLLRQLLERPGYADKLNQLGREVEQAGGASAAADVVEAVMLTGQPGMEYGT